MRHIELFAGAGGMALGLEQAGFGNVACVEFNYTACDTLRLNRPGWNIIEGDIHDVSFVVFDARLSYNATNGGGIRWQ